MAIYAEVIGKNGFAVMQSTSNVISGVSEIVAGLRVTGAHGLRGDRGAASHYYLGFCAVMRR
jgi:hypothetical protein